MKTIFSLCLAILMLACHPPEVTKVIIKATDLSTEKPIDSLRCNILESGVVIASDLTKGGQTQIAFDMKSNLPYEIQLENTENNKYKLVQSPSLNISIGQENNYDFKLLGYGNFDLGLKTIQNSTHEDYLEYQIVNTQFSEVAPVSKGWTYGEEDIYGNKNEPYFENYELPAGPYRMDYRVKRNNIFISNSFEFTIKTEETYHYILNY